MKVQLSDNTKHTCGTCHGKGTVLCKNCGGKKEFECSSCHGKGHKATCSQCGSTGKMTCTECYGTGKVEVDCRVCHNGYVQGHEWINCARCHGSGILPNGNSCSSCSGRGQIERLVQKLCPACHGDYKGFKGKEICYRCDGTGKESCDRCRGTGKAICKTCDGDGKVKCERCKGKGQVKCPECKQREEKEARIKQKKAAAEWERNRSSYQNRARFMALGVAFGLLGVHYAYIRRWFSFMVQLVLTGCAVAQHMIPAIDQPITDFMLPYSMKLNEAGLPWLGLALQYPLLLAALAWCFVGVFFVRRDGTNHKMDFDPERRVFILIAVVQFLLMLCLFGITGEENDGLRHSVLLRIGIWSLLFPFLYAKQWKYFFISLLPVLVDVVFCLGFSEKIWNQTLFWYSCWHVWAVIRTRKEL